MSFHSKKIEIERNKKVIDGVEYESTLGLLNNIYVPPYNGSDLKKIKIVFDDEKEQKKEHQEEERQM